MDDEELEFVEELETRGLVVREGAMRGSASGEAERWMWLGDKLNGALETMGDAIEVRVDARQLFSTALHKHLASRTGVRLKY